MWHSGESGASVSGTQLNYAAWAQRCASASAPTAPALSALRLLSPARPTALLYLRDGAVVFYRRAGSGMRCGTESMGMLWQHVQWHTDTGGQRYLRLWVTGKTGARWLIAKHDTAQAFERLAQRQKSVARSLDQAIAAQLPVPVFALDDGTQPYGLAGTFARLLQAAGLSRDPLTGQARTLYSLRHTYATAELLSGTDIHTLARQMGTSVHMLERHYSKLTATMAAGQLA